ncbi:DUF222 domain-containing protein [Microlunatus soli]|uniref:DUF222 domain-containing protein n=1 Tax=Microlunatus soli TaxID=630515 RepID=A0A1H1YAE4_9ACTN|nr:DUF222 domain-containing protein [Microlunatus soli]SDT18362.1 protein of unknown function [Microlunatus soli]
MEDALEDLDDRGLVDTAVTNRDAEVAAGCRMLQVAAVWADRHPADGLFHQRTPLAMAGERTMRFGGEGTPDVAEFAPAKLGLEIGLNPAQSQALVADALDLRHRLPRLWSRVRHGNVPAWQTRRIAYRTRTLSLEQAGLVDERLAPFVGKVSAGRLENKIMAELIRVDPEGFARAAEKAATDRDVRLRRPNEYGQQEVSMLLDAPRRGRRVRHGRSRG